MTKMITALAFLACVPAHAQSALDDPDTQRILAESDASRNYNQAILDRANNYNPPSSAFYPPVESTLQNATDGSGAWRVAR